MRERDVARCTGMRVSFFNINFFIISLNFKLFLLILSLFQSIKLLDDFFVHKQIW